MWLVFALLAPCFFAVVHVLDSYNVEDVFDSPWDGVVISSIASTVVFLPLPYLIPFVSWKFPGLLIVGAAFLAGVIIQINQALYFEALRHSDSGVVSAYWNMVPAFLPLASFFIFQERLSFIQYIGIIILIVASISICLLDVRIQKKWNSFVLIFVAAWLQVVAILLMDVVFNVTPYYLGFLMVTSGLIATGIFPLLFQSVHLPLLKKGPKFLKLYKLFLLIEIMNLTAYGCLEMALKYGTPSLIAAMEATTPAYTVIVALALSQLMHMPKASTFKKLPQKFLYIALMVFGVWLVA